MTLPTTKIDFDDLSIELSIKRFLCSPRFSAGVYLDIFPMLKSYYKMYMTNFILKTTHYQPAGNILLEVLLPALMLLAYFN